MTDLSDDQIMLSTGEAFTVPRLPGGSSEAARKVFDLCMDCMEWQRRSSARDNLIKLKEAEATRTVEDAAELERITEEFRQARERSSREWMRDNMVTGFEFLRALYSLDKDEEITEDEARRLFQWPDIVSQVQRAKLICMTGAVPNMEASERSDFTGPDDDSTRTPENG